MDCLGVGEADSFCECEDKRHVIRKENYYKMF